MNETTEKMLSFLDSIGITYRFETLADNTFLPGLTIQNGVLLIDKEKLLYPGDIIHEAGHIATVSPEKRKEMDGTDDNKDHAAANEMMSMAWSYAACLHMGIDPQVVFHEQGYRGQAKHIVMNYQQGGMMGVPMLQWLGMCYDQQNAPQHGEQPFPHMLKWVCDKWPADE